MRPSLGDPVLFTIEVSHTAQSGADAFDVVVTRHGAAGPHLRARLGRAARHPRGTHAHLDAARLDAGAGFGTVFTYRAVVDLSAPVDVPITNTALAALDHARRRRSRTSAPAPTARAG